MGGKLSLALVLVLGFVAACAEIRTDGVAADAGSDTSTLPTDGDDSGFGGKGGDASDATTLPVGDDGGGGGDAGKSDGGRSKDGAADTGTDAAPCTGSCPPELLADNQPQATVVIVDQANIYWGTEGTNGVWQCPKTGCTGAPIKLASIDSTGLAVDATRVYFGDFSGGALLACTIGGCANSPTVLSATETQIESVTSDGVSLYWASQGKIRACTLPCSGAAGQAPRTVYDAGGFVLDVTADQGTVFWAAAQKMYACSGASCTTPLALGAGVGAGSFATHGHVYWVASPNSVVACETGGCNSAPRTIGSSYSPQNIVSDDISVYWRDDVSGDILRCPTSGCAGASASYQKSQQGQPGGKMATDGQYLYWATASQVLRAPK